MEHGKIIHPGKPISCTSAPRPHRRATEASGPSGMMFFGTGIWLVAPIYRIEEHDLNRFPISALRALALA